MDNAIFCPNCDRFIGLANKCPDCNWQRQAQSEALGKERWRLQISSDDPVPGSPPFPARITPAGDLLIIPTGTGDVVALDSRQGSMLWKREISPDHKRRTISVPVWEQLALIGAEHLADLPDAHCDFMAWDIHTGETAWTWTSSGDSLSAPLVVGNTAYFASSDQRLVALDLKDHQICWSASSGVWSPEELAVSGNTLVVPARGPVVNAYDAERGRRLWAFEADDKETEILHLRPAVSADTAFLAGWGKRLYAVDLETGELRWRFIAERGITCPPVFTGDRLLVSVKDYRGSGAEQKSSYGLYALDAATGQPVWKFQTDRHIHIPPTLADGNVLFGADDRRLHLLDLETGQEVWQAAYPEKLRAGPLVSGDAVIFGQRENTIICIQWKGEQPERLDASTLLEQGRFLEAAAELAIEGKYEAAARLYLENGEPRHAAVMYLEANRIREAAEIFTQLNELDKALALHRQAGDRLGEGSVLSLLGKHNEAAAAFEESGSLDEAVRAYQEAGRSAYAAMLLWKAGRRKEAADLYHSINQDDKAAEVLVEDKRFAEAADIYLRGGKPELAASVLAQGGLPARAAKINEQRGQLKLAAEQYVQGKKIDQALRLYESLQDWNMVIELANQTGDLMRMANALKQQGQLERAAQTYHRAGKLESAMEMFETLGKWDRVAALAGELGQREQQAHALAQMGLMTQAGEIYEQAAQELAARDPIAATKEPLAAEALARLYEAAAKCFAEDDDWLHYGACWDKVCQYRQWPNLKGRFELESQFYQGEYNLIVLVIQNAGYSPAFNIRVQSVSQKFQVDEAESQIMHRLLGVQQDKTMHLLLQPRVDVLGHVMLRVAVSFQDQAGLEHEVKYEQSVKVLSQEDKSRSGAALVEDTDSGLGSDMNIVRLRRGLVEYFSEDELESLCFDLLIDYDNLPGETKPGKARELVRHMARRGRLQELEAICRQQRPNGTW